MSIWFTCFVTVGILGVSIHARAQVAEDEWFSPSMQAGKAPVAELESSLQSDPNNRTTRARLLAYYVSYQESGDPVQLRHKAVEEMEWFVEHAPDSRLFRSRSLHFLPSDFQSPSATSLPHVYDLWNQAVKGRPNNAAVLHNAILSLFGITVSIPFGLKLRELDPYDVDAVLPIAIALASVIRAVQDSPPGSPQSEALSKFVAGATPYLEHEAKDAAFIGTTGEVLLYLASIHEAQGSPSAKQGERLLQKAHRIDPANPKWQNALTTQITLSLNEDEVTYLYHWLEEEDLWPGRIVPLPSYPGNPVEVLGADVWPTHIDHTLGGTLDFASLRQKISPEPAFPSEMEGRVKLDLLIDEAGQIAKAEPLSGTADQIESAEDHCARSSFHPWLKNGVAVSFHTLITIHYSKDLMARSGVAGIGMGGLLGSAQLSGRDRISGVDPVYPPIAKATRIQGVVQLKSTINERGTVDEVTVVSGPPLLSQAAIDAVKTWTFKPATKDGKNVSIQRVFNLNFVLGQATAAAASPRPATAH